MTLSPPQFPGASPTRQAPGDLPLPTPPGAIRRFWARHPRLADILLALHVVPVMLTTVVMAIVEPGRYPWPEAVLQVLLLAVVGIALLYRRRHPVIVVTVIAAMTAIASWQQAQDSTSLGLLIALYSVAVYASSRGAWIAYGLSFAGVVLPSFFWIPLNDWVSFAIAFAVLMLIATLIGSNVGNRRRYTTALIDRAEQLARERDAQAQLASAAERSRIAREMHDIVAHSLTVVVALANGAEAAADRSPDQAKQAMREVRDVGRSALADMRRLLGVLRDGEDAAPDDAASALRPQPGNEDLASLVDSYRAAGVPVTLTLTGEPPSSAGLQLTVHRIVQESLTNVLRYAHEPSRVSVAIVSSSTQVTVDVRDNGHGVGDSPVEGAGQGLIGMRERVAIYRGTLEVGPGPAGGWHVHAVLFADPEETT